MRKAMGFGLSALQALSAILLLGTSTLLLSTAALHPPVMLLMTMTTLVRAFAIGRAAFRYGERLTLHDGAFRSLGALRVEVYRHLEGASRSTLGRYGRGDLLTRVIDDVDETQNLNLRVLPGLIQAVVATLVTFFVFLAINIWLAIAAVALMVVTGLVALLVAWRRIRSTGGEVLKVRGEFYENFVDAVTRAQLFTAFDWDESVRVSLQQSSRKLIKTEKRVAWTSGLATSILLAGLALVQVVAASLGTLGIQENPDQRVLLAGVLLLPAAVFEFYVMLMPSVHIFSRYRASKDRVQELLSLKSQENNSGKVLDGFTQLKVLGHRLTDGRQMQLPEFEVHAGDHVSIVGPSGSGKSTFANYLVGLEPSPSNVIFVNGEAIENYAEPSLREVFGLVEQQANLLIGSVAENLRLAKTDATDEELVEVLRRVNVWDMLDAREGLETDVMEDGRNFSGGEAGRIAFARLLLAKRQVVVLDEPSAGLDKNNARQIISDFLEISKQANVTLLLITHDYDLASLCEKKITFEKVERSISASFD